MIRRATPRALRPVFVASLLAAFVSSGALAQPVPAADAGPAEVPSSEDVGDAGDPEDDTPGDRPEEERAENYRDEGDRDEGDADAEEDTAERPAHDEDAGVTPPETAGSRASGPASEADDEAGSADASGPSRRIEYVLERIEVRGRTDAAVIRPYIPIRVGEVLDVDDPRVEAIRWRLLGTGWFDEVRLSLERGSERGRVVLIVTVSERNTFIVQSLALGFSEGLLNSDDPSPQIEPYFGISLAELNLFGTGVSVDATGLVSIPQQGFRLRAGQASVDGSDWGLNGGVFFNNGREFFGNDDVLVALDECPVPTPGDMRCEESRNAVLVYRRLGASIGTGTDVGTALRFTLDWQFEAVEVVDRPASASHRRGTEILPIDFHILDGWSYVSMLTVGLTHDERDNPGLPTSGRHVFVSVDLSSQLIGSSYDFVRVQAGWREWFRLPEARHALRLGLFVGAAVGDAPFFARFYVADMSDLIPSRVVELNLDRRAAPNLLDTSIREMRAQELAGRIDLEYSLWLYEGRDEVRGLVLYGVVGLYTLLDREDLAIAIPGYEGFARAPLDLTFDVGLRLDTLVGVFEVGFSSLLGFISL